jgi:hypothetical protein
VVKLGDRIKAGSKGFGIYEPIRTRLRQHEIEQWLAEGRNPYDAENRPRVVLRAIRVGYVFDVVQVEPGENAQELPPSASGSRRSRTTRPRDCGSASPP